MFMDDFARKRILLIDDDDDQLFLTKTLLEESYADLTVETARSGEEGLALLESGDYDCVISDFDMKPGMNGVDLLRTLSNRQVDVPFIMVTAKESAPLRLDVLREGAADFIQKTHGATYIAGIASSIEAAIRNRSARPDNQLQLKSPYHDLFEQAPYIGIMLNADGLTVRELNARAREHFGGEAETSRGAAVAMLVSPGDRPKLRTLIRAALNGVELQEAITFEPAPGRQSQHLVSASAIRSNGTLVGVVLYAQTRYQ